MEYIFDTRLILNRIKEAYNLKNDAELSRFLGVLATRITNWVSRNTVDFNLLFSKCECLNYDWLLTGTGDMYRSTSTIVGDRNALGNNTGTITGQNIGDNSINISGPLSGSQKIIHPDRTIEVDQYASEGLSSVAEAQAGYGNIATLQNKLLEKDREISLLRAQIISLQSDLIESLKSKK